MHIFPADKEKLSDIESEFFNTINAYYEREMPLKGRKVSDTKPFFYRRFGTNTGFFKTLLYAEILDQPWKKDLGFIKRALLTKQLSFLIAGQNKDWIEEHQRECTAQEFGQSYDTKASLTKYITESLLDDKGQQYALEFIERQWPKIERFASIKNKMEEMDFFRQWARGELHYGKPIFASRAEVEEFGRHVESTVITIYTDNGRRYNESTKLAKLIASSFVKRVCEHEEILWRNEAEEAQKRLQRAEREKASRAQEAEEWQAGEPERIRRAEQQALLAAEARRKAREDLRSQPYMLSIASGGLAQELDTFIESDAGNKEYAQPLADILRESPHTFDCRDESGRILRDESVCLLGDWLLSPANIAASAQAFGVIKHLTSKLGGIGVKPVIASNATSEHLNILCSEPNVQNAVEQLIDNPRHILLLATMTRSPKRCQQYASDLLAIYKKQAALENAYARLRAHFADFSDEDLAHEDFQQDKDVIALKNNRLAMEASSQDLHTLHQNLAAEIRQAFEGRNIKNIDEIDSPKGDRIPIPLDMPESLKQLPEIVNGEFFLSRPEEDKNSKRPIRMASTALRFKSVALAADVGPVALNNAVAELRTECAMFVENRALIEQLHKHGFKITDSGDSLLLKHREYEIEGTLTGKETQKTQPLLDALQEFENRHFQQQSLIEMTKTAGINPLLLPQGYFTQKDFAEVHELLSKAQKAAEPEAEEITTKKLSTSAKGWQPESDQTMLLFDSNVLQKLCAERSLRPVAETKDKMATWLDVVKQTACLPNAVVIIPSIVADWELRGRVPLPGKPGEFIQINPQFLDAECREGKIASAFGKLADSACRVRVDKNGVQHFKQGDNPNIIIWETAKDDEALYNLIRDLHKKQDARGLREALQKQVYRTHAGEKAIERLVDEIPNAPPVVIISDDNTHFRQSDIFARALPRKIGLSSTASYLNAEVLTRPAALDRSLKPAETLSLYSMIQGMKNYWDGELIKEIKNYPDDPAIREDVMRRRQSHYFGRHTELNLPPLDDSRRNTSDGWAMIDEVIFKGLEKLRAAKPQNTNRGILKGQGITPRVGIPTRSIKPDDIGGSEGYQAAGY